MEEAVDHGVEDYGEVLPMPDPVPVPEKKKRKKRDFKKAPGAPRRPRSAYVLFSMENRDSVKETLPEGSKVTDIMKAVAEMWRGIDDNQRDVWNQKAAVDKARYEAELEAYDGPLKVPNKRARKNPLAPKRAMSAFLHFSQVMRPRLREQYPDAKNVDMSKMLGEEWNRMIPHEKAPYQAKAAEDTARYQAAMREWRAGGMVGPAVAPSAEAAEGVPAGGGDQGYQPEEAMGEEDEHGDMERAYDAAEADEVAVAVNAEGDAAAADGEGAVSGEA